MTEEILRFIQQSLIAKTLGTGSGFQKIFGFVQKIKWDVHNLILSFHVKFGHSPFLSYTSSCLQVLCILGCRSRFSKI